MLPPVRNTVRSLPTAIRVPRSQFANRRYFRQTGVSQAEAPTRGRPGSRKVAFIAAAAVGAAAVYLVYPSQAQPEPALARAEVRVEKPRKVAQSNEENRDLISAQHLQVKKSWENPGVYAWGSNIGRVVAPDLDETIIKTPRRISYFDGKLLRDIKLDRYVGAAIADNGDLLQWGTGFSPASQEPTPTLKGKGLVKLSIARNRIIALASDGTVYSVPTSQSGAEKESSSNHRGSSWFQFWKTGSSNYETLKPDDLGWGEKVTDVSCGQEHCLALTSAGRVFSCAIGNGNFTSKGQLGVANTQLRQPRDSAKFYKVDGLQRSKIAKIATGDYHSLLLDTEGRVHSFGDNSAGQLGFEEISDNRTGTLPTVLTPDPSYKRSTTSLRAIDIAAGGANSFITIETDAQATEQTESDARGLADTTVDIWAFGQGITGTLGNGRWTHVQSTPTKVKALSGLREYDEKKNAVVPIRVSRLSVGATHACAVLDNVTNLGASSRGSKNDTNFGSDVLWWGGNEFYQLGTGKRNNVNTPTYIPPLDLEAYDRDREYRFQLTPRKKISVDGKKVSVEQRIECGRGTTAVYSGK